MFCKFKQFLIAVRAWLFFAVTHSYYNYQADKYKRKYVVLGDLFIGLGTRLIPLANTYAWLGKENITLVWPMDDWMPEPFEKLFEMSDAPGFQVVSRKYRKWDRFMQTPRFPEVTTAWYQFWAPPPLCEGLPNQQPRFMCDRSPDWAKCMYRGFFSQLYPTEAIRRRIQEVAMPDDVVCVQIRNSHTKGDASRVARPATFFDKMRTYGPVQKFYVSCMEPDISEQVHREFGEQVIELPNKNYRSMVDAVADMWLLGKGRELICQKHSTFAEIACWWGGCQTKVIGVEPEYVQD